jgi:hypothetical protein
VAVEVVREQPLAECDRLLVVRPIEAVRRQVSSRVSTITVERSC